MESSASDERVLPEVDPSIRRRGALYGGCGRRLSGRHSRLSHGVARRHRSDVRRGRSRHDVVEPVSLMDLIDWPTFDEWWAEMMDLVITVLMLIPPWIWLPVLVLLTALVSSGMGQHDP